MNNYYRDKPLHKIQKLEDQIKALEKKIEYFKDQIEDKTLEEITNENKVLLVDNEKMRHIIEDVNIIHYFHPTNIKDAVSLNKKLTSENLALREKLEDIYDL